MKIITYLINLDTSHERLICATKQLNAVKWDFERYSAYDGRGKPLNQFEDYDDKMAHELLGRSLMNSELGCYLSHYGCVEKFLQTDADYLVVLEDDLNIDTNFKEVLNSILSYLYQQSDLEWYLLNIAAKKKKFAKDIGRFENVDLWHAYYFPIRGLGLVWSRKGAQEFLALGKTMSLPIDILFQVWLSKTGKGLGVWPALVKPAGVDSDILGTIATQGVLRKTKENRDYLYGYKKQKRMWRDRYYALGHLLKNK